MRRTMMMVAAVLAWCAAPAAAQAPGAPLTGTLKKIADSGAITLGWRENSTPFSFRSPDGTPKGFSIDLCLNVVELLKAELRKPIEVRWKPVTIETRFAAVAKGEIDLECGSTTNTLARRRQVDFSLPTFVDGATILHRTGIGITDLTSFGGKRIGVVPGSTSARALAAFYAGMQTKPVVVQVKDHDEGQAGLEAGTLDAYCSDRTILIGLALKAKNPGRLALMEEFLSYEHYGLVLRRGDAGFRLTVDSALARLYRTGAIGAIYRFWFGDNPPSGLLRAVYILNAYPE